MCVVVWLCMCVCVCVCVCVSLIDLFCTLLAHAEPEQRIVAVKHLGILLGQCTNGERAEINSQRP